MRLRLAEMSDLERVHEVVRAAFEVYLQRMDRPPAPMLADYASMIQAGELWVTGAPVTGVVALCPQGDALSVETVAVHPSAQGQGIGGLLLRFAEAEAARRGLSRMVLYTNVVMRENLGLYLHLGYIEIGRREQDGYARVFLEKVLSRPGGAPPTGDPTLPPPVR